MTGAVDDSMGTGVYYRDDDYPSFSQRLGAVVVVAVVLTLVGVGIWYLLLGVLWYGFSRDPNPVFWIAWPIAIWGYMAALKPSPWRTVGFRLFGLKVVNLKGNRPSVFRMTFRLLLWMFGPFQLLLDLAWMGADTAQQTLRDCYAGTCVVASGAEPIGEGPIRLARYGACGMMLSYPRVIRATRPVAKGSD